MGKIVGDKYEVMQEVPRYFSIKEVKDMIASEEEKKQRAKASIKAYESLLKEMLDAGMEDPDPVVEAVPEDVSI